MADGVDIDLYSEDIDQNYGQMKDGDYVGDEDLYDDVVAAPSSEPHARNENENGSIPPAERAETVDSNGSYSHMENSFPPNHPGRRHQLYVGNLTWWTTDQDITDAVGSIGVNDFQEVKFFENRANGQSKGFCVISLGSETSMRMCMDRLSKNELHGQKPVVTLPTKAALAQFESQQKTRPIPPPTNAPRGQAPGMQGPPMQGGNNNFPPSQPQNHPPRMMMPNGPPGFRPPHMQQNMGGPMPPNQCPPPRMQQPMRQMGPNQGMPPRFPNQNQWNGPPRQNGPRGMPPNCPPGPPQHRPMFQGNPNMPPRGPRGDWNRPPQMHQGFNQGPNCMPNQGPNQMMQGPPRGPNPQQMNNMHGGGNVQQMPAPHVNPAFFNSGGPPQHHPHHPNSGGMNQPPQNMQSHGPQHFSPMDNGPRFQGAGAPKPHPVPPTNQFPEQPIQPQMSEAEFEEIMTRNRTVSSSAIARAVSDAAAGEAMSAIETLVTAISLIKQSKVAQDERCKILISSLQDTLHGIESKSSYRRSRSRDRSHRDRRDRPRRSRERSTSKDRERRSYRERSRERGGRSYYDSGSSYRDNRSRSRDRTQSGTSAAANSDHYSERSNRPRNKSPDASGDPSDNSKRYYEERYNRSSRDRDRREDREHRRH